VRDDGAHRRRAARGGAHAGTARSGAEGERSDGEARQDGGAGVGGRPPRAAGAGPAARAAAGRRRAGGDDLEGADVAHAALRAGLAALVDGGVDIATAVSAPRWFVDGDRHYAPPVNVRAERRFPPEVVDALEAFGHPLKRTIPFNGLLGHAHAIELVDGGPAAEDGSLCAATDPRSQGLPAVW